MKNNLRMLLKLPAVWRRGLGVFAGVILLLLGAIACRTTTTRTVVQLPEVPGANYIGSKECEQCHQKIYQGFATADHARLIALGTNSMNAGCESCHGPCSLHAESGGETKPPYSFTAGRPTAIGFGARVALQPARATENVCFNCHTDVRGQFDLPSHHPVPEGDLSCSACHSPHKGSINVGGGTQLLSENEACSRCHTQQRGPYAFEHEAMHEGCTICHTPHGSVNAKLLTVRDANLCLKCHFQQVSGGTLLIGGSDHTLRVQQGTCWTAGCHEAVHGSRVSSSLRF
jgi:predicted CXXCH cytochrome family protein